MKKLVLLFCFAIVICSCRKETSIIGTWHIENGGFEAVNLSFAIDGTFSMDNQPDAGTWEKEADHLYNVYVNQNIFQVYIHDNALYFPCLENQKNCRIKYNKISEEPVVIIDSH